MEQYDVAIVGGGLAGLSLANLLARNGRSVILFEKEQYPFHRVCGEYISMESWNFLQSLGLDLEKIRPSQIKRLQVSGINGKLLEQDLPLGGFGVSRHFLDYELVKQARKAGAIVEDSTRVTEINFESDELAINVSGREIRARLVAGAFGKRSNLDIRWKRPFTTATHNRLNNYIGVKYHIRTDFPVDTIALHNFRSGYCGISKIEGDRYCLCYLTTARNLKKSGGNLAEMEKKVLGQNPFLKKIWSESEFIYDVPLTISQISFDKKSQVERHVLMVGDAAGMITPLCGNGMSMALHGSKIASEALQSFLDGKLSRKEMEKKFTRDWRQTFGSRLRTGRWIQRMFGRQWVTNLLLSIGKISPRFVNSLIRHTHGEPF